MRKGKEGIGRGKGGREREGGREGEGRTLVPDWESAKVATLSIIGHCYATIYRNLPGRLAHALGSRPGAVALIASFFPYLNFYLGLVLFVFLFICLYALCVCFCLSDALYYVN